MRLWQSSWRMIADQPMLGYGLDNFLYAYRDFYVQRDVIQERGLSHPHNVLLDVWTRLGLPGLILGGLIVAGNVRLAREALRAGRDERRAVAAAALGMQVYALAHGLVDNSVFLVDLASAWWIAQAALLAMSSPASGDPWPGEDGF
jgi:O-antigen ligase